MNGSIETIEWNEIKWNTERSMRIPNIRKKGISFWEAWDSFFYFCKLSVPICFLMSFEIFRKSRKGRKAFAQVSTKDVQK